MQLFPKDLFFYFHYVIMYMYMEAHIRTVPLETRSMKSPGTWAVGLLQKQYVFFIIDAYLQPHKILYFVLFLRQVLKPKLALTFLCNRDCLWPSHPLVSTFPELEFQVRTSMLSLCGVRDPIQAFVNGRQAPNQIGSIPSPWLPFWLTVSLPLARPHLSSMLPRTVRK